MLFKNQSDITSNCLRTIVIAGAILLIGVAILFLVIGALFGLILTSIGIATLSPTILTLMIVIILLFLIFFLLFLLLKCGFCCNLGKLLCPFLCPIIEWLKLIKSDLDLIVTNMIGATNSLKLSWNNVKSDTEKVINDIKGVEFLPDIGLPEGPHIALFTNNITHVKKSIESQATNLSNNAAHLMTEGFDSFAENLNKIGNSLNQLSSSLGEIIKNLEKICNHQENINKK